MTTVDKPQITYFDNNEHPYLSNFYEGALIRIGTRTYATGEHAFQAYKATNLMNHNAVRLAATPSAAKTRGRSIPLRPDWEAIKYDVMRLVLARKFMIAREEGRLLLDTGDAMLIEGTHWGDQVWGVDLKKTLPYGLRRQHPGRNWLGHLLMARRAELRAQAAGAQMFNYHSVQQFVNRGINT